MTLAVVIVFGLIYGTASHYATHLHTMLTDIDGQGLIDLHLAERRAEWARQSMAW